MAVIFTSRHARLRRWTFLVILAGAIYYFWPNKHIENLSNHLVADPVKNDYLENILNPKKDGDEAIYSGHNGPIKAIFDPGSTDLDAPDEIDADKIKQAMDKLNLDSPDQHEVPIEGSSLLSDTVLKSTFSPIDSLDAYVGNIQSTSFDYYKDLTCPEVAYKTKEKIEHSEPIRLEDDFFEIRDFLLNSKYQKLVSTMDVSSPDGATASDIKHWYKKAGSSIWLPKEQLHMVATTVMYAPNDVTDPLVSFIRLQLFDSNWMEVKNRRIKYKDLSDSDIHNTLKSYTKSKDDTELDFISLKFPSILNIPIDAKKVKKNAGPENPRMIFKQGDFFSEPVIIFNMAVSPTQRNMFAVFPFRKPYGNEKEHKTLKFKNIGNNALTHLKEEKNWVPFFDTLRVGDSKRSRGNIHFVYTLDPLVIFRCSLDSGSCSKLQDNVYSSSFSQESVAYLRGGTSFFPIPKKVVTAITGDANAKKTQMWVSFSRFNIKKSPCGNTFHRPTLTLLVKEDGIFRLELITAPFDFGMKVAEVCEASTPSIINANSIAFWNIKTNPDSSGSSLPLYDDYMCLVLDTQNEKVEIIFLKNVLNYILNVYADGNVSISDFDSDDELPSHSRKVSECALNSAVKYANLLASKKNSESIAKIIE